MTNTGHAPLKTIPYTLQYYTYAGNSVTVTTTLESTLNGILKRVAELSKDLDFLKDEVPMVSVFLGWLSKVPEVVENLKRQDRLVENTVANGKFTREQSEHLYKELLKEVLTFSANIESYWDYVARVGLKSDVPPTVH
jgi:hypothetical protein